MKFTGPPLPGDGRPAKEGQGGGAAGQGARQGRHRAGQGRQGRQVR